MVGHFRPELTDYLLDKYQKGKIVEDPYELVKEFCIDNGTKACATEKIPSVERKKKEMDKLAKKDAKAEL